MFDASAVLDAPLFDPREEAACLPLERLEAEITQLAGNLAAAECRWLLLVAEFDRRRGWEQWGCRSLVHWLGWHCALDERAAREKVRVARALTEFGVICEQFARGRLSYSKVRAITRIATPETEADLVSLAEHASAAQVERLVAAYRRTFDPTRRKEADERHTKQSVQWFTDDDGSFVMQVRLDPEDGTFLRGVIEANTEGSIRERPRERRETVGMRRAAALMEMAVLAAGSDAVPLEAADRYLVMVNVDETVLTHDEGTRCELDGGPGLPAETARRVACDASCVRIVRDALSQVVDVGRKTRVIPRWMRRQLHARDGGCVFPGCSERRIVIGHHIHHWTRGGETELRNLIELCAFHHRLVHEGGWTVTFDGVRLVTFFEPDGTPVSNTCRATGSAEPFAPDLEAHVAERGVDVTPRSVVSKWYGEPLDLGLILPAFGLTLETARSSGSNGARDTEHMANDRSIADQLAAHVDDDFCYLTTRGRVTRRPHEIEIWFALDTVQPTTLFLMAGGGDGSDWVRNLRAEPDVTVRVGDATYAARARVIDAESDEDERARTLVHDKFAPRYSGDLTEWRGRALPVAVDVVDVAQS